MRVIIAGGRDFSDKEVAFEALNTVINPGDIIVSGHARGADMLGEMYAKEYGLELELYPAEWDKYGRSAGYIRNRQMAEVADALVAFWDGKSRGTKNMIETAEKLELPVFVFDYEGIIKNS